MNLKPSCEAELPFHRTSNLSLRLRFAALQLISLALCARVAPAAMSLADTIAGLLDLNMAVGDGKVNDEFPAK